MSLFLVFDFVYSLDLFVVVYHKFIQFVDPTLFTKYN